MDTIKYKEETIDNLRFLGLDLEKTPEAIDEFEPLNFRPLKMYDERKYVIYKHIKISNIEILLTPTDRITSLSEKYKKASPLFVYLDTENEENIEKHVTLLKMIRKMNKEKIKKIEEEQNLYRNNIPFIVKYENNYLWQIYYSESTNKYFMLVPTEESENEAFFYLLKKKIEKSEETVYVPISHEEYKGEILKNDEIIDLENYLWLFTKDWPSIYEVQKSPRSNNMEVVVIGKTIVYEKVKSDYKVILKNREEAIEFYKLIKALYIIKTNLTEYEFKSKINDEGGIDLYFEDIKLEYKELMIFLKDQMKKKIDIINEDIKQIERLDRILKRQKINAEEQYAEYTYKQNQVIVFLDCKKTFLGKIKYFFSNKKKSKKYTVTKPKKEEMHSRNEGKEEKIVFDENKIYTIEDLITIGKECKKEENRVKNLQLDIKAIENKMEVVEAKIENLTQYIKEIDSHKKSIWEFIRYVNKDEAKVLSAGIEKEEEKKEKLERYFEYDEDIEEFGRQIDEQQRREYSKEMTDAIFIAKDIIELINSIDEEIENNNIIKEDLLKKKEELNSINKNEKKVDFDIFGSYSNDITKIKLLKNKKHREIEKDKFKILDINENTTENEYKERIRKYKKILNEEYNKINVPCRLSIYKIGQAVINGYDIYDINEKNLLANEENKNKDEIILTKISVPEGEKLVFYSNIVYYDNLNKTLPLGMDVSTKVLIDLKQYEVKNIRNEEFKINFKINDFERIIKKINVQEFEIKIKKDL